MNDDPSQTSVTGKTLARLRALAKGNGTDPQRILLTASDEKTYTFEGTTTLTPFCETREERYGGPPRGKDKKILPSAEALNTEVKKHENDFRNRTDWIEAVKIELRKEPGEGWGLDNAKIPIREHSATFVSSEICQACKGRRRVTCTRCFGHGHEVCYQCKGQRQEICYTCNGAGHNPQFPDQPCAVCHGTRYISCRICYGKGQTICPLCQSRGGTPCPTCKGVGQTTREIHVTCGATTHFAFKSDELPSGLRRGLDRLGIANLSKGHAEIAFIESKKIEESEPDKDIPGGLYGVAPGSAAKPNSSANVQNDMGFGAPPDLSKLQDPVLHYMARMPFADLRIDFAGKKVAIGVFGLRNVFLDVPFFLDEPLGAALGELSKATRGKGSMGAALETRALHEAVSLHLQGKGNAKEFRRFYPIGISGEMIDRILRVTRQSIKRLTMSTRTLAAVASGILNVGLLASCYYSPLPERLLRNARWGEHVLDFAPLILAEILNWVLLNFATYFNLHKHFPEAKKIGYLHNTGKIGYAMAILVIVAWIALLALSPVRPAWLPLPVHK